MYELKGLSYRILNYRMHETYLKCIRLYHLAIGQVNRPSKNHSKKKLIYSTNIKINNPMSLIGKTQEELKTVLKETINRK